MLLFSLIICLIILFDQLSKYFIEYTLFNSEKVLIDNILSFTYVQNKGAAWGILSGYDWIFQFIIPIFIIIIVIYAYIKRRNLLEILCTSFIAGGALGNYIDRILRGYVVDFIDFKVWPVFNLADICIVLGCVFMCIMLLKKDNTTS